MLGHGRGRSAACHGSTPPTTAEPADTRGVSARLTGPPSRSPWTQTSGPSWAGAASASSQTAQRGAGVDEVAGALDGGAGRAVVRLERPGAVVRLRRSVDRHPLEAAHDLGEVAGERDRVVDGVGRGALTGDPPLDGPLVRVPETRCADGDRFGHGDRERRGEPGQPLGFLLRLGPAPRRCAGSRTTWSSPSRQIAWSVPHGSTIVSARSGRGDGERSAPVEPCPHSRCQRTVSPGPHLECSAEVIATGRRRAAQVEDGGVQVQPRRVSSAARSSLGSAATASSRRFCKRSAARSSDRAGGAVESRS